MNESPGLIIASDSGLHIRTFSDIPAVVGDCIGTAGLILTENDLGPDFFDLRTGLAGEAFQKLTNYRIRVAIVLPVPTAYGERFGELANEHRSHNMIRFVSSLDEAKSWLLSAAKD
jgi:hypothetical protein